MDNKDESATAPQELGRRMTREELIKAVTEGGNEPRAKKRFLRIPSMESEKVDFKEIMQGLNVEPDSKRYQILKAFCEGKNASLIDIKALIHRMENLSAEQLNILELICSKKAFTSKNILQNIQFIKQFGQDRLLALRAFIDIKGLNPVHLDLFFKAALPHSLKEVGKDAYQKELQEKKMAPDQVNGFYNICYGIPGITHVTAIAILPKVRLFSPQHARLVNTFLKKGVIFGKKTIDNENIAGLINLILSLPALNDTTKFSKMIVKLSRQPDDKKKDFQYVIQTIKTEIEKEKSKSGGMLASGIRNLFS